MEIDLLKKIILEGQALVQHLEVLPRDFEFEPNGRYVFVGIRQAGKSYMLYNRALQLIAEGHKPTEILLINFDDERLIGFEAEDFDKLLQAYGSLFEGQPIVFLDEVQNVPGWQNFARRMANYKYQIYITGSNAKMLSKDISTTLGARYLEQTLLPYSFKEFLTANNLQLDSTWEYGEKRQSVERQLTSYLKWGGFPDLLMYVNKRKWLNELYEKIILGDIALRNNIKNVMALRMMVKRMAETVKQPVSYNRLTNILKSTGTPISINAVIEYIKYCRDAFLMFSLDNFASKFTERETVKKHYFIDNGLLSIFLEDSETALLENLCAITLYRRFLNNSSLQPYFYNKEAELDFYIPEERKAVQACYNLADNETFEREVRALCQFHRDYGLKSAEIVTMSEECEIQRDNLTIKIIPLSKWLLSFA